MDEVLLQARVHPERLGASLMNKATQALHEATYRYLPKSFLICAREWDDSATPGTDAHEHHPRHSLTKIAKFYVDDRAAYICPKCQSAPASAA